MDRHRGTKIPDETLNLLDPDVGRRTRNCFAAATPFEFPFIRWLFRLVLPGCVEFNANLALLRIVSNRLGRWVLRVLGDKERIELVPFLVPAENPVRLSGGVDPELVEARGAPH